MKALTLLQPWASLVALGDKKIETRSWKTNYRGQLVIHASVNLADISHNALDEPLFQFYLFRAGYTLTPFTVPLGKILCIVELKDCVSVESIRDTLTEPEKAFGDYSDGRFAWILSEKRIVFEAPVPAKGHLGLWNYREENTLGIAV